MDRADLIDKHRYINTDHDWYTDVSEMLNTACSMLGIELASGEPTFCGFGSQGDGASFTGKYRAWMSEWSSKVNPNRILHYELAPAETRDEFPQEPELHRIADELCVLSRIYYPVYGTITRNSTRYTHSGTMNILAEPMDGDPDDWADEVHMAVEDKLTRLMRALADWMFSKYWADYEYRTSDEAVWESIEANGLDKEADDEAEV